MSVLWKASRILLAGLAVNTLHCFLVCSVSHAQSQERTAPVLGSLISPPGPGPISALGKAGCTNNYPKTVIKLRLERQGAFSFLTDIAAGNATCSSCVSEIAANANGDDEDFKNGKETARRSGDSVSEAAWHTPFDIDITARKEKVVLLKIILEKGIKFVTPTPADPTNSSSAIWPGAVDAAMFQCRSEIRETKSGNQNDGSYVTVQVNINAYGKPQIAGGLNIGIIAPQGNLNLPIFLDPNVRNNG